jgi:hypothetical protein
MKRITALSVLLLGLAACAGGPDTPTGAPPTTPVTTAPSGLDSPVPAGWVESPFVPTALYLRVMESFPMQVRLDVSGDLPTPCHQPFWTVVDDGSVVAVTIVSATAPDQVCAQVIEPVELSIPLGDYVDSRVVTVDGEEVGSF